MTQAGGLPGGRSLVNQRQRAGLLSELLNAENELAPLRMGLDTGDAASDVALVIPGLEQQGGNTGGCEVQIGASEGDGRLAGLAQTRLAGLPDKVFDGF
jgi:hypothetical protein